MSKNNVDELGQSIEELKREEKSGFEDERELNKSDERQEHHSLKGWKQKRKTRRIYIYTLDTQLNSVTKPKGKDH